MQTQVMDTETFTPAMVFALGDFLDDEAFACGYDLRELADLLGYSLQCTEDLLANTRPISPLDFERIALAFGSSASYWRNIDALYRAHPDRQVEPYLLHLVERT